MVSLAGDGAPAVVGGQRGSPGVHFSDESREEARGRRRPADFGTASSPTQQLAEFLALISCFNDERTATRKGIEHVAEVLDAEVAALVRGGAVIAAVGFAEGEVPIDHLVAVADGSRHVLAVPGAGECEAVSVPLEDDRPLHLVVARRADQPFQSRRARPAAWNGPGPDARLCAI